MNSLYIAAVLFGLAWLLRRKPSEAVSSDWVKQQIAERGKRQQP